RSARQMADILWGYSSDTVIANYVRSWFHRFHSGVPVVENVDKFTEKIKSDRHGATPVNTKNIMDRISICEALAKRNEIDLFLKRMGTGDEK
ncbi:hypothetical protein TNCT_84271, partial [Trichonephila clavata]